MVRLEIIQHRTLFEPFGTNAKDDSGSHRMSIHIVNISVKMKQVLA